MHQEMQNILGIILLDVLRAVRSYWSEALVVVEFLIYNTPGPHNFTPRDIDRGWSVAAPLAQEILPFDLSEFEPVTDYVRTLFKEYIAIRDTVVEHYEKASATRAKTANLFRKQVTMEKEMKVVYRDPRSRAAGEGGGHFGSNRSQSRLQS